MPNLSGPAWQSITNVGVLRSGSTDIVASNYGNLFLPQSPEIYLHDVDGNLTNDGRGC